MNKLVNNYVEYVMRIGKISLTEEIKEVVGDLIRLSSCS
jgi:hypothetical protein